MHANSVLNPCVAMTEAPQWDVEGECVNTYDCLCFKVPP